MKIMKLIISTLTFFAFALTTLAQIVSSFVPTDDLVGCCNKELKNNKNLNVISDIYE
jgi:hypothetical protein